MRTDIINAPNLPTRVYTKRTPAEATLMIYKVIKRMYPDTTKPYNGDVIVKIYNNSLTKIEKDVMYLKYFCDLAYEDIAFHMGITESKVRQVESDAFVSFHNINIMEIKYPEPYSVIIEERDHYWKENSKMYKELEDLHKKYDADMASMKKKIASITKEFEQREKILKTEAFVDMTLEGSAGFPTKAWKLLKEKGVVTFRDLLMLDPYTVTHIPGIGHTMCCSIVNYMMGHGFTEWANDVRTDITTKTWPSIPFEDRA